MDISTLGPYIYDELGKRLGRKVTNIRRSPFSESQVRNINATKKADKKIAQKAPVKRIIRLCSVCRKAGHIKTNCPGVKRTKKVNYAYALAPSAHDEVEKSEDPEEEYIEAYILEEEEDPEEDEIEEVEDDEEEYDDNESRNCYAVKKKWYKVEYL